MECAVGYFSIKTILTEEMKILVSIICDYIPSICLHKSSNNEPFVTRKFYKREKETKAIYFITQKAPNTFQKNFDSSPDYWKYRKTGLRIRKVQQKSRERKVKFPKTKNTLLLYYIIKKFLFVFFSYLREKKIYNLINFKC